MTFAPDIKCCIRSCGNTKEKNGPELCKEWLQKIHLGDNETVELDKLHLTHVICSKHFLLVREVMRLFVDDENADNIKDAVNNENANNNSTSSVISKVSTSVSVCTQTFHDDWFRSLKVKYGTGILYGKNVQCRVCVEAANIYNKCNEHLNLENLINKLLPIKDTTMNSMDEYEIRDSNSKLGYKEVLLTDSTRPLLSKIIKKNISK